MEDLLATDHDRAPDLESLLSGDRDIERDLPSRGLLDVDLEYLLLDTDLDLDLDLDLDPVPDVLFNSGDKVPECECDVVCDGSFGADDCK